MTQLPPRVLHVEDDEEFSYAIKLRLEAHGVAVVRAFDGLDGVMQSLRHHTDAILLDFEMPSANGDEVLVALRSNEQTSQIPVIVLSGRKDQRSLLRMTSLGAAGYLTKPLNFGSLRTELAKHIDILSNASLPIVE